MIAIFASAIFIIVSFLIGLLLLKKLIVVLGTLKVLDHPSWRSSHNNPVVRGGGIVFFLVALPACLWFVSSMPQFTTLILCAALIFLLSLIDDIKELNPLIRILVHIFASAIAVDTIIQNNPPLAVPLQEQWLYWIFTIYLVGFTNLFNFMDGIDGMSAVSTIHLLLGIGATFMLVWNPEWLGAGAIIASLLGAAFAFLIFNWHPAKIFLGDCGAHLLGFVIGILLIKITLIGYWQVALILPGYYYADGGITLLKRIVKREKIWQAAPAFFFHKAHHINGFAHNKIVSWTIIIYLILQTLSTSTLLFGSFNADIITLIIAIFVSLAYLVFLSNHKKPNTQTHKKK